MTELTTHWRCGWLGIRTSMELAAPRFLAVITLRSATVGKYSTFENPARASNSATPTNTSLPVN